jgi:hypothetical protein
MNDREDTEKKTRCQFHNKNILGVLPSTRTSRDDKIIHILVKRNTDVARQFLDAMPSSSHAFCHSTPVDSSISLVSSIPSNLSSRNGRPQRNRHPPTVLEP